MLVLFYLSRTMQLLGLSLDRVFVSASRGWRQTYVNESILGVSGLLLVGDGFLIPGKDTGSLSLVPINGDAVISLTTPKSGWWASCGKRRGYAKSDGAMGTHDQMCPSHDFRGRTCVGMAARAPGYFYHTAQWIDLNGDGKLDLVTARATTPLVGSGSGELLWLEQPASDPVTNGELTVCAGVPCPCCRVRVAVY